MPLCAAHASVFFIPSNNVREPCALAWMPAHVFGEFCESQIPRCLRRVLVDETRLIVYNFVYTK